MTVTTNTPVEADVNAGAAPSWPLTFGGQRLLGVDELSALSADLDYLVAERLAPGTLTVMAGAPGAGKSLVTLDLVLALVGARPWLGHDVGAPARVLYIDDENPPAVVGQRVRALGGYGSELHYCLWRRMERLSDRDLAYVVGDDIDSIRPRLIVVDTLSALTQFAENDPADVQRNLLRLRSLAWRVDAALLVLHHLRKFVPGVNRAGLDSVRGSSAITGAADAVWLLFGGRQNGKKTLTLHEPKNRMRPEHEPMRIEVVEQSHGKLGLRRSHTADRVELPEPDLLDHMLLYISQRDEPVTTAQLVSAMSPHGGERSVKGALNKALTEGYVRRPRHGVYELASAG